MERNDKGEKTQRPEKGERERERMLFSLKIQSLARSHADPRRIPERTWLSPSGEMERRERAEFSAPPLQAQLEGGRNTSVLLIFPLNRDNFVPFSAAAAQFRTRFQRRFFFPASQREWKGEHVVDQDQDRTIRRLGNAIFVAGCDSLAPNLFLSRIPRHCSRLKAANFPSVESLFCSVLRVPVSLSSSPHLLSLRVLVSWIWAKKPLIFLMMEMMICVICVTFSSQASQRSDLIGLRVQRYKN